MKRLPRHLMTALLLLLVTSCANYPSAKAPPGVKPFPKCQREPFAHEWSPEQGVKLPYIKELPKSGKPKAAIILVTGLDGVTGDYASITQALTRQGYAVYGSENRSTVYGPESEQGNPHDWKPWVQDLRGFHAKVKRLQPGLPVFWHAHSFGAVTALAALDGLPKADLPKGLILHSPGYALIKQSSWWEAALGRVLADWRAPHIAFMDLGGLKITEDEVWDWQWKASDDRVRAGVKVRFITQARKMGQVASSQATKLPVPTLALWGRADKLAPGIGFKAVDKYKSFMEAELAGSSLKVISFESGGHILTEGTTKKDALAAIISWLHQQ